MVKNMEVLQKLIKHSYDPVMPLFSIYLVECAPVYCRATFTPMFIAPLFRTDKIWKQSKCSMTDEWIKKMWYIYTMEFYLAIEKNKIVLFAGKWMELENFMLGSMSLAHMCSLMCGS
jgi:hypothetical protein